MKECYPDVTVRILFLPINKNANNQCRSHNINILILSNPPSHTAGAIGNVHTIKLPLFEMFVLLDLSLCQP